MRRGLGLLLFLVAICTLGWILLSIFRLDFWLLPPKQKFLRAWYEDIKLLEASKKLPSEWNEVREIVIRSNNSPAQEWIAGTLSPPIRKKPTGTHRLNIFVIHWEEGNRYGAIIEYSLIRLSDQNTDWELGRTLKLGIVY